MDNSVAHDKVVIFEKLWKYSEIFPVIINEGDRQNECISIILFEYLRTENMEKQHLSVRDEIGFSSSLSHQDRVILHIFIDSFADLLHSSEGLEYVFFINTGIGSGCKIILGDPFCWHWLCLHSIKIYLFIIRRGYY